MKKIYGIVGHPVNHSLSPAMHNAAFRSLGIDAEYGVFDVEPHALEGFLASLEARGISGINVTIPHKIEARRYIEKSGILDREAAKLGAVNTVVLEGGRLKGYNTDGPGFYRSCVTDLKCEPEGKRLVLLGAGGAATAIAMYLGRGPKEMTVFDVDEKKARELSERYRKCFEDDKVRVCAKEDLARALETSDLLVNATPLGMKAADPPPIDVSLLRSGTYVYDLVYNRPVTSLVKEARARKLYAVTGLGMLLYQGAIAFEIWTGRKSPIDEMKKALARAVKEAA